MNTPQAELIEEALSTYPLAEVPPNFSMRIMRQIRKTQPAPKFRLTWMDYALWLFLCLLPVTGFAAWAMLPMQVIIRLRYQWLMLNSPALEPVAITFLVSALGLAALALIAGTSWLIRPQTVERA
jgi:hypothetical protein